MVTTKQLQESLDAWVRDTKRELNLLSLNVIELGVELRKVQAAIHDITRYEKTLHKYLTIKLK